MEQGLKVKLIANQNHDCGQSAPSYGDVDFHFHHRSLLLSPRHGDFASRSSWDDRTSACEDFGKSQWALRSNQLYSMLYRILHDAAKFAADHLPSYTV